MQIILAFGGLKLFQIFDKQSDVSRRNKEKLLRGEIAEHATNAVGLKERNELKLLISGNLHFSGQPRQTSPNVSSREKRVAFTSGNIKSGALFSLKINDFSALLFAHAVANRLEEVEAPFNLDISLVFRCKQGS